MVHHPTPGFSTPLSSPLQHQANCLQAIHKTIQQFSQHLKAEHLDRQILQLNVLQLQIDFALLRYLHFSPVETIFNKDISVKNSATSPLINPNPNPHPTSSAFPLPCTDDPKFRRSTPVGAVGPSRAKTRKQTILQAPISNPHPTRRKFRQLRCRTLLQEFANRKIVYRWNSTLHIHHCGDLFPKHILIWQNSPSWTWQFRCYYLENSLSEVCIRLCKSGLTIIWTPHWTGHTL